MAQKGEPGRALGLSAGSTCFGGFVGCVIFVACIQVLNQLTKVFHPPDLMMLVITAILLVGTIGAQSVSKAIISGALGLMLASIGLAPLTGVYRYTFNQVGLVDGISLVALALGLIAIPRMVLVFGTSTATARQDMLGRPVAANAGVHLTKGMGRQLVRGVVEAAQHWKTVIVSGVVGALTGIIPGIGAFTGNFIAYGLAQQTSKRRELFGTGIPEGIIAPEGSSLAKEAGSLVPVLGIGIPGGIFGAFIISMLAIKGVSAGIGFTTKYPTLPYEMMWVMLLGGLIGTSVGVLLGPLLAKITRVPGPALFPLILCFSVIGVFVTDASFFSVVELLVFTIFGIALRRLGYSLASFLIALVLAPELETNVSLTRSIYPGLSWLERPISAFLAAAIVAIIAGKIVQERRARRQGRVGVGEELRFPVLELVTSIFIVVASAAFAVYGFRHYDFLTNVMPGTASVVALLGGLWCLARAIPAYLSRHAPRPAPVVGEVSEVGERRLAEEQPHPVATSFSLGATVMLGEESALASVALPGAAITPEPPPTDAAVAAAPARYPEIRDHAWGRYGQYTREVMGVAWVAILIVLCYLFGFLLGAPLFCIAYGCTATGRVIPRWRWRLLFSALTALVAWVAIYETLHLVHLTFTPVITF